ncbi:ribbon-helix-helix domain-containing protein [Gracilimonas amylolytica]|uniref:ribbon-helix-helix domain-containing protein n=1 Tax=Gracilimonas amylolytica TaxID=1749045 RepID=UPI000CD8DFFE|nr:CopG family transcriptional regulator [Gracilimonas amylolytica]
MKRTQIYLTEEEKKAIEKLSDERGTTQSNIIREAIDEYVAREKEKPRKKSIMDFAGIWKDKKDLPDIDELRDEWEERLDQIYNDR